MARLLPDLEVTELDDVNHYTMLMAAAGVAQIAPRIADFRRYVLIPRNDCL